MFWTEVLGSMGLCKQVIFNFLLAIILALYKYLYNQFELMFGVSFIDTHLLDK